MIKTKGSLEVPVIRFLDEEQYARALAESGSARLRRLEHYRQIEGARRDASEGEGRIAKGPVPFVLQNGRPYEASVESTVTNPIYILCFSDASADLPFLARRFKAPYGVEFADADALSSAVPLATVHDLPPGRSVVSIRVARVEYDKGLTRAHMDMAQAVETAFAQKPGSYECEKEWRLAIILSGARDGAPDHIHATFPIAGLARVHHLETAV